MAAHLPPIISQTVQYALQALIYLSAHQDRPFVLGSEISDALGIPANYLSKIMHTLGRDGLIEARRGRMGGYRLQRDADRITVMDVFALFDDRNALEQCFLGRPECSDRDPCAAHAAWGPIREAMRAFMITSTVQGLASSAGDLTQ